MIDLKCLEDGTDIAEFGTINVLCYLVERYQYKDNPRKEAADELFLALVKWLEVNQKLDKEGAPTWAQKRYKANVVK